MAHSDANEQWVAVEVARRIQEVQEERPDLDWHEASRVALWRAVRATKDGETNRCAVCAWPLAESAETGCVRGNCSMRPLPGRFYDPERAAREAIHA